MPAGATHRTPAPASRVMHTRPRLPEEHVVDLWLRTAIPGSVLTTSDGRRVDIISTGLRNRFDGPDFLGCRLRLDGRELVGALEVHCFEDDWFTHGHQHDIRYEEVIMHVVLYGALQRQRRLAGLPTIVLTDTVPGAVRHCLTASVSSSTSGLACASAAIRVPGAVVAAALELAATERFARKCAAVVARCRGGHVSQEGLMQATWELSARALGYGGNEAALERLATAVAIAQCADLSEDGILRRLVAHASADGGRGNARGVRPGNRLGGRLRQLATLGHRMAQAGWWAGLCMAAQGGRHSSSDALQHCIWPGAAVEAPGPDRFREMLVNVCAPVLAVHAQVTNDHGLHRAACGLYFATIPAPSNRIIRTFSATHPLPEPLPSGMQQGVLELFTNACLAGRCGECLIGNSTWR